MLNVTGHEVEENLANLREIEENIVENKWLITDEKLKQAVDKMRNGKAPGDDELPAEIIKKIGNIGLSWLLALMNLAWQSEQVPDDWIRAVICTIHKKGEKTNCENYRGIFLLSHTGEQNKRFTSGFRPGRGTTDHISTLKILMEKCWEWNQDKFVGFIDFDRIPRDQLWQTIGHDEYKVPQSLIKASIYKKKESRVKTENRQGQWFNVRNGVRQG